jgi:3-oxoacyl-[acyl-carrier protein] reductase
MELMERVAFVSGGSGSLGSAIAKSLAAAGAHVCVGYLTNEASAQDTARAVEALGRQAVTVQVDQTDPASVDSAVEAAVQQFGRLDILINNAAQTTVIAFANLEALTPEVWDRMLDINLRGPFLLARAAGPHLRRHGAGRLVNIASIIGLTPMGSNVAFSVAKAGLIHLTRCLAVAVAPDVSVNCVAPSLMEGTHGAQLVGQAVVEAVRQRTILKRNPTVQEATGCQVSRGFRSESGFTPARPGWGPLSGRVGPPPISQRWATM